MRTYVTRLGCPKNLVDTEASLSLLRRAGCSLTDDPGDADLMIVSACSFLDAAWQETVDEVKRLADIKRRDRTKKLVLMGCLPRHRPEDLRETLPLVDRFVPSGAHSLLPSIVAEWRGEKDEHPAAAAAVDQFAGFEERSLLTPGHTAYVKIAEGCSRRCSFCAIPQIRGRMVSRSPRSVVREVENLLQRGVKEVTLLAQDITSYYADGCRFDQLVERIAETGVDWIRIFYVHPGSLTLDLARRLFRHSAVCRYLESPIQHASNRVLKRMRRPYTKEKLERVFAGIRAEFPDVRIRSEVIVGFPGEDDSDFETLKQFVGSMEFASLGIFPFSPENSTAAASLDGVVPENLKAERAAELDDIQRSVSFGLHNALRDEVLQVLVDQAREDRVDKGDWEYTGRHYGQAPEVDGGVLLSGEGITVGEFVKARITDSDVFDLRGEVV